MKQDLEYHHHIRQWRADHTMLCLTLNDGAEAFGRIISSETSCITILAPNGDRRVFGFNDIKSIEEIEVLSS